MPISQDEVKEFTRGFADKIRDGVALVHGLSDLAAQQANPALRQVITDINREVQAGETLSRAMAKHPAVFDERYIVTVRYGEIYGILDETLQRLL